MIHSNPTVPPLHGTPVTVVAALDGSDLTLEIAETPDERRQGLSDRSSLGALDGMLFVFAEEGRHSMWMKDMLFSLDIIWIDDERRVVFIEEYVSPETYPRTFASPEPARYVLEVDAGRASEEGWDLGSVLEL